MGSVGLRGLPGRMPVSRPYPGLGLDRLAGVSQHLSLRVRRERVGVAPLSSASSSRPLPSLAGGKLGRRCRLIGGNGKDAPVPSRSDELSSGRRESGRGGLGTSLLVQLQESMMKG